MPFVKSCEQKQSLGGKKAGYCTCPLHTPPPNGWANCLSYPSSLTPGHILTLRPYKEPAHSCLKDRMVRGSCCLFLFPSGAAGGPKNALSKFPVWPLINLYWLRRPRTLASNIYIWEEDKIGGGSGGGGLDIYWGRQIWQRQIIQ